MSNTANTPTPDASTTVKGKLQLAGSLGGTAASPTVVTNANLTGNVTSVGNATTIAAAVVTNAMLSTSAGQIGAAWVAWTPTWTNMAVTNSTVTAKFLQIGKGVWFRLAVVLAGGDKPSGSVSFTLPVTSISYAGTATLQILGPCQFFITNVFGGNAVWASTTTANFTVFNATGTYIQGANISATVPGTFTNGSELHATGFYEAA